MPSRTPTVKNQVNVITLQCAKQWHRAFLDQNREGFAPGDLPSSIVIPFIDVEQIVHDFKIDAAETINGIRIYFVLKPGDTSDGKPKFSVILVPTTGPIHHNSEGVFHDLIVNATLKAGAPSHPDCIPDDSASSSTAKIAADTVDAEEGEEGYSSIYDFTRPCPPYCGEGLE